MHINHVTEDEKCTHYTLATFSTPSNDSTYSISISNEQSNSHKYLHHLSISPSQSINSFHLKLGKRNASPSI